MASLIEPSSPDDFNEQFFSSQIGEARRNLGLSRAEVAVLLAASSSLIWQWEMGLVYPRRNRLESLAEVLNLDYTQLVYLYDKDRPAQRRSEKLRCFRGHIKEKIDHRGNLRCAFCDRIHNQKSIYRRSTGKCKICQKTCLNKYCSMCCYNLDRKSDNS